MFKFMSLWKSLNPVSKQHSRLTTLEIKASTNAAGCGAAHGQDQVTGPGIVPDTQKEWTRLLS